MDGADEVAFKTDAASITASQGALGSLTIAADGTWTYSVDNSLVQYLGKGRDQGRDLHRAERGRHPHTVTITITGVNDGSVRIGGSDAGTRRDRRPERLKPAGLLSDSGQLKISDVDGPTRVAFKTDAASITASQGALGSLSHRGGRHLDLPRRQQPGAVPGQGRDQGRDLHRVVRAWMAPATTVTITITGVNDGSVQISGSDAVGGVTEPERPGATC